ncbi:peptidylprolyl isomerase [Neisseria sp. Ec49-e6-T10]|uniref:peptidylprolyl isomerase n=1 Tax=Neisseria sp. Ec49-e6-T10 TaxID=3140744 RepID=UPI003EBDB8F5
MFHAVEKFQTPAKIILGLIALTFVGGVGYQFSDMGGPEGSYITAVGDSSVSTEEIKNIIEAQQLEQSDQMNEAVYIQLLRQKYLIEAAKRMGFVVSQDELTKKLKEEIIAIQAFQENGTFSQKKYDEFLKSRNITERLFVQARLKEMTEQAYLMDMFTILQMGQFSTEQQIEQLTKIQTAVKVVRTTLFNPERYIDKVVVNDKDLQKFYDTRKEDFAQKAAIKMDVLTLSIPELAAKETITDAEIKAFFDANQARFNRPERQVSHILLTVPAGADETEKEKVKKEAEKVLAEVKANPNDFAALAKKYSKDPSAANGGDLGYFAQDGTMVKAFEDAAFSMKKGEVSTHLVETPFGYHILKVMNIKEGKKTVQEVKAQIEPELKLQKAQASFADKQKKLVELTSKHNTELTTAAKELGLTVQSIPEWMTKEQLTTLNFPEAAVNAIFTDNVLNGKNSGLITVDANTVFVMRAKETQQAKTFTLAEIKPKVEAVFKLEEAKKLALKAAQDADAKLTKGETVEGITWDKETTDLTLDKMQALPEETRKALVSLRVKKDQPAYLVSDTIQGPLLIKVESEKEADSQIREMVANQIKGLLNNVTIDRNSAAYLRYLATILKEKSGAEPSPIKSAAPAPATPPVAK